MIIRNDQVEHVWSVQYEINFFEYSIFVRGTEDEMRAYMKSEMSYIGSYHALTEREIKAVNELKAKIYIAPVLKL